MPKVVKWVCTFCDEEVTEDQTAEVNCPHCDCTWCGPECCDAYPKYTEIEIPDGNDG